MERHCFIQTLQSVAFLFEDSDAALFSYLYRKQIYNIVLAFSTCCWSYDIADTASQRLVGSGEWLVVAAELLPERTTSQDFNVSLVNDPEIP